MMKKWIALLLSVMLVLCSAAALADSLTFTTGSTSGTYYAYGTVLANYVTNNTGVTVTAVGRQYRRAGYRGRAAGLRAERRGQLRL